MNPEQKKIIENNAILAQSPWATKWGKMFLLETDKFRDFDGDEIYNSWYCNTGFAITPFCDYKALNYHNSFDEMAAFIQRAINEIETIENGQYSSLIKNAWNNMNKVDLWNYLILFVKAYNKEKAELN